MELLDCYEKLCSCCESSISTDKFYAFSAETEEHFEKIEQEIADIEASGLTYEGGDYIKIEGNVISVTGIDTSTFASKEDLNELSGKVETLSAATESAVTETELNTALATKQNKLTAGSFIDIDNSNTISVKAVVLSRAAWEALVDRDPTILYLIRQD